MKSEVIVTVNDLPPEVLRAIAQGRKIEAIKLLRESTGIGLANAKVLVDRAASSAAARPPGPAFLAAQGGGTKLATALVVVSLLIGFYFFYFSA